MKQLISKTKYTSILALVILNTNSFPVEALQTAVPQPEPTDC